MASIHAAAVLSLKSIFHCPSGGMIELITDNMKELEDIRPDSGLYQLARQSKEKCPNKQSTVTTPLKAGGEGNATP